MQERSEGKNERRDDAKQRKIIVPADTQGVVPKFNDPGEVQRIRLRV